VDDTAFDVEYKRILGIEGPYVDNPNDSGGATRYGITEGVASAHGYTGAMQDLPILTARDIYKSEYWDTNNLDNVSAVSTALASKIFDAGVNMGVKTPGEFLQRALNVLNLQGQMFAPIAQYGQIGPGTLACLEKFVSVRGDHGIVVLLRMMNGQQVVRYMEICEARPQNDQFIYGWIDNRIQ